MCLSGGLVVCSFAVESWDGEWSTDSRGSEGAFGVRHAYVAVCISQKS